jgi:hypothetical protein
VRFGFFEMLRPRELDKDGHHDRGQDGITNMIGEADGQEPKKEFLAVPIPKILMEQVNGHDQQKEEEFFHWIKIKELGVP